MFSLRAATGTDIRNKDYVLGNNNATFSVNALTPPDLALHQSDYPGVRTVTQNQPFTIDVLVYNAGQTAALNVSVAARSEEHTSELQSLTNLVCRLLLEKK